MTTLYIRDVPDEVAESLKPRAAAQNQSLSAYVNAQLAVIAARPGNAEIVARLRRRDRADAPTSDQIADALAAARR